MRKANIVSIATTVLFVVLGVGAFAQDGHMKSMKMKPGSWVYSADILYACSHHPDAVTAKPDHECFTDGCSMEMKALTPEQADSFRSANLIACSMASCSFAAKADSSYEKCPVCGMSLKEVEHHHMMHEK